MKFIFADAIDQVDPGYDFIRDQHSKGRRAYWDDAYPHEIFKSPPYDGILISRGIVGDSRRIGTYSSAQAMRLRREGAREFLRLNTPELKDMPIYGDCGAFSYVQEKVPPYSPQNMAEFYADGRFTYGCSVDHIIFGFRPEDKGLEGAIDDEFERFQITQENAREFINVTKSIPGFTPLGAVQGWSPDSMGIAAENLEKMGYNYLAIGGMVPLTAEQIHLALKAIRNRIKRTTKLHILGFAKAEQIGEFTGYGIASFDSTSPLIRAFKDAKANFYSRKTESKLDYYTAIRIPLATENSSLKNAAKEGKVCQDDLLLAEKNALAALRAFDKGGLSMQIALDQIMIYQRLFHKVKSKTEAAYLKVIAATEDQIRRTLIAAPWKKCRCAICVAVGIEVIIFRSNNRNKRRGFHNLQTYYEHVQRVIHGK